MKFVPVSVFLILFLLSNLIGIRLLLNNFTTLMLVNYCGHSDIETSKFMLFILSEDGSGIAAFVQLCGPCMHYCATQIYLNDIISIDISLHKPLTAFHCSCLGNLILISLTSTEHFLVQGCETG